MGKSTFQLRLMRVVTKICSWCCGSLEKSLPREEWPSQAGNAGMSCMVEEGLLSSLEKRTMQAKWRHLQTVGESPCQDQSCVSQMKNKTGGAGSDQCTKIQFRAPEKHQAEAVSEVQDTSVLLIHLCPCSSSHRKMPHL